MKSSTSFRIPRSLFGVCLGFCLLQSTLCLPLLAQPTAFTYQGHLTENNASFTGVAEMQFTLWDFLSGGTSLATNSPSPLSVDVADGVFTVDL